MKFYVLVAYSRSIKMTILLFHSNNLNRWIYDSFSIFTIIAIFAFLFSSIRTTNRRILIIREKGLEREKEGGGEREREEKRGILD